VGEQKNKGWKRGKSGGGIPNKTGKKVEGQGYQKITLGGRVKGPNRAERKKRQRGRGKRGGGRLWGKQSFGEDVSLKNHGRRNKFKSFGGEKARKKESGL